MIGESSVGQDLDSSRIEVIKIGESNEDLTNFGKKSKMSLPVPLTLSSPAIRYFLIYRYY
jgi:hypothetical protein